MSFENYHYESAYNCSPYVRCIHFTPLMYLISDKCRFGNNVIIDYIINNKSEINLTNDLGWTALMIACADYQKCFSIDIIQKLLEYGADVNIQNNKKETALMLLLKYKSNDYSYEIVKMLINYGANVNIQNNQGLTALFDAAVYDNLLTCKLLIDHGSNINLADNSNMTILMHVCTTYDSNIKIIKLLLDNGANINTIDKSNLSALLYVAKNMKDAYFKSNDTRLPIILLLLEYGADYTINSLIIRGSKNKDRHLFKYLKIDDIAKCINVINKLAIKKTNFSNLCGEIISVNPSYHAKPDSFRFGVISMNWNIKTNNIEKNISWKNLEYFNYFGIYDYDSLIHKITDAVKFTD
ncbi:putative ankyrin repeat protein [Megavirus courdo11]|uniref:Putative ankyrin repeat protein n=1 Tax=Megavirus courdo11 TaxID=1128140 RepID=K7YG50_9VIRU|nr:putative ankyrin repeat protein [Megavirus courdo11]